MTYIVNHKNKQEQKVLEAILKGLSIGFYTEEQKDAAFAKAMEKGRKTRLLTIDEKQKFLNTLQNENGNP